MNCADCQRKVAGEEVDAAVLTHLDECMECRAFERELAGNAAALRSLEPPEAAYTALRARVMGALPQQRRPAAWWWPVPACAAAIAVVWSFAAFRPQPVPPPVAITYRVPAPEFAYQRTERKPSPMLRRATHNMGWSETQQRSEVAAIKLLTDDPNVVIIWLPNEEANKKGGS